MSENRKMGYKKLFRSHVNFLGGKSIIRVTDDHFLYAESNGYSEDYKRFFFADIQAIKMVKKRDWGFVVILVILALTLALNFTIAEGLEASVVFIVIITVFAVIAVMGLFFGPPVKAIIKTAYSSDTIMFGRVRRAEKNLRKMTAYLEGAQNIQLDEAAHVSMDAAEKVFKV